MWLWASITAGGQPPAGVLRSPAATLRLSELVRGSALGGRLEALRGRSVLVTTGTQLASALALIELDGVARRLVLCTPDLAAEHLPTVARNAEADAWVHDALPHSHPPAGLDVRVSVEDVRVARGLTRRHSHDTEWILLTSGTTGVPKLVAHSLASLTSALGRRPAQAEDIVWSTFYDIRRYGGLQIFLRALYSGSLVLSSPGEPVAAFFARAAAASVTHISGTPSHWRRALMSGVAASIAPRYVRLSGEIADQAILDGLRAAYPAAQIAHAFASTEAGVAFEVGDGRAGFPASLVADASEKAELKIHGGTLHVRSPGNAARYLGDHAPRLKADDGFVDTGDRVELTEGRYYFVGRNGGVINVGGLKVHPEEVEAVINSHPWVRMSLVKARRSPITGAVVTADIVLADNARGHGVPLSPPTIEVLTREIIDTCRRSLAPFKVPAVVRIVPALELSASGKLVRPSA